MDFHDIVLLVPLLFAVHNVEETPRMAAWSKTLPGRSDSNLTTSQFAVAVALLTLLVAAVALWCYARPADRVALIVLLEVQAAIGVNAIVPHLALYVGQRRYNPGLVTALFLNVPFSALFFRAALAAGAIGRRELAVLLLVAPAVIAGSAILSLRVAALVLAAVRAGN